MLPGIFESLKPTSIMLSKSRRRLSSSPIICKPSTGSPLNCTLSEVVSREIRRRNKFGVRSEELVVRSEECWGSFASKHYKLRSTFTMLCGTGKPVPYGCYGLSKNIG